MCKFQIYNCTISCKNQSGLVNPHTSVSAVSESCKQGEVSKPSKVSGTTRYEDFCKEYRKEYRTGLKMLTMGEAGVWVLLTSVKNNDCCLNFHDSKL